MINRSQIKSDYKQSYIPKGIFQIKNNNNGKIFLGSGMDVNGILNRHKAELKFGSHKNKELLQDWNELGGDNFSFEVIDRLEPKEDPNYDYREDLKVLFEMWLEKLQPFGERGYNK